MADNRDEIIRNVTERAIDDIITNGTAVVPADIQDRILSDVGVQFDLVNAILPRGRKLKAPERLAPSQIAMILARLYPVRQIVTSSAGSDSDYALLGVYQDDGVDEGIYDTRDEAIRILARKYCFTLTIREFAEMVTVLRDSVEKVYPCREKNLIAVNNGIFDYDTKQLMPFTPEKVFLSKSKVNYNPNASNVVIHNDNDGTDWDVESWMQSLSDDSEIVNTLWEVLGAIIRPNVPWDKSAWFYSETGNNGKGTLCELMRQICGEGRYASIALSEFGKDFMLEPLTHSSAIIVDENDVGTYIDKAANLKAIITGDTIQINRKFKTPIPYKFRGFMVQCLNEMPRIKDKSDSFFRRQLFVPFTKCFTGSERKYIKHDYLHRQEVLEYVLYRVLNMDYYELSTPDACKSALDEYKEFNDPVRQFMKDIMPRLVWDLVPFSFLHDLYVVWYQRNVGNRDTKSSSSLRVDIIRLLSDYPEWSCPDYKKTYRPKKMMDKPEPLIAEYNLENWMNPFYRSSRDVAKSCIPPLKSGYKGLIRVGKTGKSSDED